MCKRIYYLYISLFALFIFYQKKLTGQTYNFDYYSVNDGLSQSQIRCLYEDSRGFIWCGTSGGGLCRFDGKSFKTYNAKDGLVGQIVNTITEDKEGNLWIGTTWGGVEKFDGKHFTNYTQENGLLTNNIKAICVDDQKNVWIGSDRGLNLLKNGSIINFNHIDLLRNIEIEGIKQDKFGTIWIATNKGIIVYANQQFYQAKFSNNINLNVKKLYKTNDNQLLLITDSNNVFTIDIASKNSYSKLNKIPYFDSLKHYYLSAVTYNKATNTYFFGTSRRGILKVNTTSFTHINKNKNLENDAISSILVGQDEVLWIGSDGNGLMSLRNKSFLHFGITGSKTLNNIFSICQAEGDHFWVATLGSGIYEISGNQLKKSKISQQINYCRSLAYNKTTQTLWLATFKGLFAYQNGKLTSYNNRDDFKNKRVKTLCLLSNGNLAIGTLGEGLFIFDGKSFQQIGKSVIKNANIHSLVEDKKGNLWIGTGIFVYQYDGHSFQYYGREYGFCNSYIGSMTVDKFNRIWFSTDRCVNMFDGKEVRTFGIENGLNSTTIYLVEADQQGNVWVGTNNGLNKIVISATGSIEKILDFSENRGFYGVECNTNASFCDASGNLWFGTINGLFKYTENNATQITPNIRTYITNVSLLFDTSYSKTHAELTNWFKLPNNQMFKHNENNLSFDFLSICKKRPYGLKFSYMLQGFDNKWSKLTDNKNVTYSNLPPGKYVFKVKSMSQNGTWSVADTYHFTIKAPFWTTWWFYLLAVAFLAYTILFIIRFREKRRKAFQKMLEKTVKARTYEITHQKEEIELLLKEVHHRVKNNMQVINSLISLQSAYTNDKRAQALFEDCKNRIRSMALIHEKLYESQDLQNVSIQEYVSNLINHLVKAYDIDSEIKLEEKIEVNNFSLDIIIPLGLIINEVVSNSLKHAFKNKQENHTANTIYFSLKPLGEKKFEMIIGDNGSGFNNDIFNDEDETLGMELIKILTAQIDGEVSLLDKKGTWYKINFSA